MCRPIGVLQSDQLYVISVTHNFIYDEFQLLDAVVGFEKTLYVVDEPQEVVEVCAMVYSSCRNKCPIPFAFEVHISTVENSIGKFVQRLYILL